MATNFSRFWPSSIQIAEAKKESLDVTFIRPDHTDSIEKADGTLGVLVDNANEVHFSLEL